MKRSRHDSSLGWRTGSNTAVSTWYTRSTSAASSRSSAGGADGQVILLGHDLFPLLGGEVAAGDGARA